MALIVSMLSFYSSNIDVKYATLHKFALYGFLISFLVNYIFFTFYNANSLNGPALDS